VALPELTRQSPADRHRVGSERAEQPRYLLVTRTSGGSHSGSLPALDAEMHMHAFGYELGS
jgi:hypothetical protein